MLLSIKSPTDGINGKFVAFTAAVSEVNAASIFGV